MLSHYVICCNPAALRLLRCVGSQTNVVLTDQISVATLRIYQSRYSDLRDARGEREYLHQSRYQL